MPSKIILPVLITALIFSVAGFLTGRSKISAPGLIQTQFPTKSPLFLEQRAIFQGKITKFDGSKVSLENKQGLKGEYALSAHPVIFKQMDSAKLATPSSDLKEIELNKEAVVVLKLEDAGGYKVTNINYLAPQSNQEGGPAPASISSPAVKKNPNSSTTKQ